MVRRAVVGDAKAIALVVDRAEAHYSGAAPPLLASPERLTRWARLVREPGWWAFVAAEPGRLVGVVSGAVQASSGEAADGVTHLGALAVEPERWGLGIGRRLLLTAMAVLPALGWRWAELWTQEPNARARMLYESTGWRPTGARRWHQDLGCHIVQYSVALAPPPPPPPPRL
jgi:GNAT superfamily N-acetyltransferase